ncbi:MAG TPA: hypothetical protein VHK90_00385 [Thermoanaerobaculia bacterium]|nr:hypothetical protein [Thermoanaerobaculia bacterium]
MLLFALLFAACASSNDGFIDERASLCQPGQAIEIEAGLDAPGIGMQGTSFNATAHVQLSNNSDDDVVVKTIRITPTVDRNSPVQLESGYLTVNETLKEGESDQYEVPLTVNTMRGVDPRMRDSSSSVDLDVTVILGNDDSYRCRFRVPVSWM